jgi:predicted GNAT superfamily acetyltransferase
MIIYPPLFIKEIIPMTIEYRELLTVPELDRTIDIQLLAWGRDMRSIIAVNMLQAVIHAGGMVMGAILDGKVIGYGLAVIGRKGADKYYLWSHQTAVEPEYQRQAIGLGIKLAQRDWALAHGYDTIGWTFDPLQHKNSRFNLHKLGATGEAFIPDFYGDSLQDDLNRGMRTNRIEVMWHLNSPRVEALARGIAYSTPITDFPASDFLVRSDNGEPITAKNPAQNEYRFIEIPYDINGLKIENKPLAIRWQDAVGEGLRRSFEENYIASDCHSEAGRCWIVLNRIHTGKNG